MAATMPFPNRVSPFGDPRPVKEDYRADLAIRLMCPNCKEEIPNIIEEYSSGDLICGTCGLVLGDRIVDTRSEWRTFANDEGGADPSRVGGPTNSLVDSGAEFSTVVSSNDGNTGIARDLQRTAQRTAAASGHMRNLPSAFQEIDAMCDSISLPRTVADVAKQLFKRADDERLLRGKQITAIIAACIFIACRQAGPGVARSFKEIVALTGVSKKLLGQCFKVLAQSFETSEGASRSHTPADASSASAGGTAGAEDLMTRFCNHLALPVPIQLRAIDIVRKCTALGLLDGRSPMSVAGACILFATHLFNQPKSAREISAVAGVSDSTIRNAYKYVYAEKEQLVEKAWLDSKAASFDRLPVAP